jgi:hypothetical protein
MMNLARPLKMQANFFKKPFRGRELFKNKVQWLDFASSFWSALKALPFANILYAHFASIMQFLRSPFNF